MFRFLVEPDVTFKSLRLPEVRLRSLRDAVVRFRSLRDAVVRLRSLLEVSESGFELMRVILSPVVFCFGVLEDCNAMLNLGGIL